jgi:hypothetical protein
MVHGIEHHHEAQVGVTHRNEALDLEVASHGLEVGHILLDGEQAPIVHPRGAAPVAHVVEDERVALAQRGEVPGKEQPARDDDRPGAVAGLLVVQPDTVGAGDPAGVRSGDRERQRQEGGAHAALS